jgi:hypothetical protein
MSAREKSSGGG